MLGAECQAPPTMLSLIREPLLVKAIHRRMTGQAKGVAADGASTLSAEWVAGTRKEWFVENQRGGSDLIEAGVALSDHKLVDTGLREFEWGYARQAKDGGFPETGDPFHSTSIFVLDSGRALIALRERREEFPEFMPRVDKLAADLKNNPRNPDGWERLMRARMVLGETDKAVEAYRQARQAFAGTPAAMQLAGISPVTRLMVPITELSPIFAPFKIMVRLPIQTLLPMTTGLTTPALRFRVAGSIS